MSKKSSLKNKIKLSIRLRRGQPCNKAGRILQTEEKNPRAGTKSECSRNSRKANTPGVEEAGPGQ